ncbi:hypothetical protein T492DRAFT_116602 [Pavlovales sp. CCMP2436]|nr:hypothetical protein T492DRAFT_116602 [Pavlovales sp. CCMP2436]
MASAVQTVAWDEEAARLYAADDSGGIVAWHVEVYMNEMGLAVGMHPNQSWQAHEETTTALALAKEPATKSVAGTLTHVLLSASAAGVCRLWLAPVSGSSRHESKRYIREEGRGGWEKVDGSRGGAVSRMSGRYAHTCTKIRILILIQKY